MTTAGTVTAEIEDPAETHTKKIDMFLHLALVKEGMQRTGMNTTGTHASLNAMTGIEGIGMMTPTVAGDAGMMTTMVDQEAVVMEEAAATVETATVTGGILTEMTDTLVVEAGRDTTTMTATTASVGVEVVVTGEVRQDVIAVHPFDAARHRKGPSPLASDPDPTPSGTFLPPASKAQVLSLPKLQVCSVFQVRQDW